MTPTKACPILVRRVPRAEVLVFRHPVAGVQLVKGTIEVGESPRQAALRELREESGIREATVVADIGIWLSGYQEQIWSFHYCQAEHPLPDDWVHHATDDGGHDFKFFWHAMDSGASDEWHAVFQRALAHLRKVLPVPLA